jgi:hypothetical protein
MIQIYNKYQGLESNKTVCSGGKETREVDENLTWIQGVYREVGINGEADYNYLKEKWYENVDGILKLVVYETCHFCCKFLICSVCHKMFFLGHENIFVFIDAKMNVLGK